MNEVLDSAKLGDLDWLIKDHELQDRPVCQPTLIDNSIIVLLSAIHLGRIELFKSLFALQRVNLKNNKETVSIVLNINSEGYLLSKIIVGRGLNNHSKIECLPSEQIFNKTKRK